MKYVLFVASFVFALTLRAQEAAIPGDLLVMVRPGADVKTIASDLAQVDGLPTGLQVERLVSGPMRTWLLRFDPTAVGQERMLRGVRAHAGVELAQNNHRSKVRAVPNDPGLVQQWHHERIGSAAAWDITTGGLTASGDTIVVCIVENCDLPHPDLIGNAWYNFHEVPNNGVDDDNNGYVDDFRGWNAETGNDAVYGGGHGTEVAGMIGAEGDNGSQVVGANWHVKLMVVENAGASDAGVLASYSYPLTMRRLYNSTNGERGAFVVATNASWGIDGGQPADAPIWCAMYDTLGTAGVLNCGATANDNVDIDVVGDLPTGCPSEFLISVTATNVNDERTFSGFGINSVDLGAPGDNVFTTALGGGATFATGTSFATPLTAGVVALLYSVPCEDLMQMVHADPVAGARYVRDALFGGVEQVGNLPGNTATGGRLNAANSVQWLMDRCTGCIVPFGLEATDVDSNTVALSWSTVGDMPVDVRYRAAGSGAWTTVSNVTSVPLNISELDACANYEFQVRARCDGEQSPFSNTLSWRTEGCCQAPVALVADRTAPAEITLDWTDLVAAVRYDLRYRAVGATDWVQLDDVHPGLLLSNELSTCTAYEFQVRSACGGGLTAWSESVLGNTADCEQCTSDAFCPSMGTDASAEWIARVIAPGLDNASGNNAGYASFTGQTATFVLGVPGAIVLEPGYVNTPYAEYFTVWMDLDRDGQFTTDERVLDQGGAAVGTYQGTITVPATAAPGPVRMRVIMRFDNGVQSGCSDAYDFGETEDYCADLIPPGPDGVVEAGTPGPVQVYPVPASEQVRFISSAIGNGKVHVLDAAGRSLGVAPLRNGAASYTTASLSAGAYAYHLMDADGVVRLRGVFIVAH